MAYLLVMEFYLIMKVPEEEKHLLREKSVEDLQELMQVLKSAYIWETLMQKEIGDMLKIM